MNIPINDNFVNLRRNRQLVTRDGRMRHEKKKNSEIEDSKMAIAHYIKEETG